MLRVLPSDAATCSVCARIATLRHASQPVVATLRRAGLRAAFQTGQIAGKQLSGLSQKKVLPLVLALALVNDRSLSQVRADTGRGLDAARSLEVSWRRGRVVPRC